MEIWETYLHCAKCGAPAGEPGRSPFHCSSCGWTRYFNPACAVAAFILDAEGRALFIRRAREPAQGKFGMPGGFIDCGETAEQATRREVQEEVGLALGPLEYLGSWPNRYRTADAVINVCDLFFIAPVLEGDMTLAADEVTGYEWIDPLEMDLEEMAFDSMRNAIRAYIQRKNGIALSLQPKD